MLALEGTYQAWIGGERYVLEEGDSVYFSSTIPHAVRLIGDRASKAIWFSSPPFF